MFPEPASKDAKRLQCLQAFLDDPSSLLSQESNEILSEPVRKLLLKKIRK
jgi:hypothetical protein